MGQDSGATSRLTSITYKQNGTTVLGDLTYEYDKNGNRTKIGGSFARTGLPQAVGSTAYNAANHQTTFGDKTLTYDNNGNLQTITDSGVTTTYTERQESTYWDRRTGDHGELRI